MCEQDGAITYIMIIDHYQSDQYADSAACESRFRPLANQMCIVNTLASFSTLCTSNWGAFILYGTSFSANGGFCVPGVIV